MKIDEIEKQIGAYRRKRSLTVRQLAEKWGLPYSTVRDWGQGCHGPRGAALRMVEMLLKQ